MFKWTNVFLPLVDFLTRLGYETSICHMAISIVCNMYVWQGITSGGQHVIIRACMLDITRYFKLHIKQKCFDFEKLLK